MFNWLRKKLGVPGLCPAHSNLAPYPRCPACQLYTRGYGEGLAHRDRDDFLRTPKIGKRPQRYDEIERDRARRHKGKANADVF